MLNNVLDTAQTETHASRMMLKNSQCSCNLLRCRRATTTTRSSRQSCKRRKLFGSRRPSVQRAGNHCIFSDEIEDSKATETLPEWITAYAGSIASRFEIGRAFVARAEHSKGTKIGGLANRPKSTMSLLLLHSSYAACFRKPLAALQCPVTWLCCVGFVGTVVSTNSL